MLCLLVALQPRENHNRLKSLNILFRPGSEAEAHLRHSRVMIENARKEREELLRQIAESEKTIARSRELISRLDELLAGLSK